MFISGEISCNQIKPGNVQAEFNNFERILRLP